MSDFFMNDRYRVLECMAQRQIIVNNEAVIKLSQQEIDELEKLLLSKQSRQNGGAHGNLKYTISKVNSIIRELIQKGYVTQVNARGKYALTENANRELQNMQSKEAVV